MNGSMHALNNNLHNQEQFDINDVIQKVTFPYVFRICFSRT